MAVVGGGRGGGFSFDGSGFSWERALVKAKNEIKTLEVALKKNPQNFQNRREYAELLATLGDWNRALEEFSKLNDKTAEISRSELSGKAKPAIVAEFWWDYKADS